MQSAGRMRFVSGRLAGGRVHFASHSVLSQHQGHHDIGPRTALTFSEPCRSSCCPFIHSSNAPSRSLTGAALLSSAGGTISFTNLCKEQPWCIREARQSVASQGSFCPYVEGARVALMLPQAAPSCPSYEAVCKARIRIPEMNG